MRIGEMRNPLAFYSPSPTRLITPLGEFHSCFLLENVDAFLSKRQRFLAKRYHLLSCLYFYYYSPFHNINDDLLCNVVVVTYFIMVRCCRYIFYVV